MIQRILFAILVLMLSYMANAASKNESPRSAVPIDAINGILDAFRDHDLVGISEGVGHGDIRGHEFLRKLISDRRFPQVANDIVVEFGTGRYQDTMDRFVRGDDVAIEELQHVWQDTTSAGPIWDGPVYEEFFLSVRRVNEKLPQKLRLRVLLGDPPIDWDKVHSVSDWGEQQKGDNNRDPYTAKLIRREVLEKHRRALLIFGGMHFQRRNLIANYGSNWPDADTLVMRLEKEPSTRIFTIWSAPDLEKAQPDIASWRISTLTKIRGTVLGAKDFSFYFPYDSERREVRDGRPFVIPRDEWRTLRMEEQFDAILYAGPSSTITYSRISKEKCADTGYLRMRLKRMAAVGPPMASADELRKFCNYNESEKLQ